MSNHYPASSDSSYMLISLITRQVRLSKGGIAYLSFWHVFSGSVGEFDFIEGDDLVDEILALKRRIRSHEGSLRWQGFSVAS